MSDQWSFGDEYERDLELTQGPAVCHHCGAPAAKEVPASYARCQACKRLLHTCYNCALYNGVGCLIRSLDMRREGAEIGQFCPSFVWRKDQAGEPDNAPDGEPSENSHPGK
jgi:hypothetical protein